MAYHRGNANLTGATADDLRTPWQSWTTSLLGASSAHTTIVADEFSHAKYFTTRNLIVVSLDLKLTFNAGTPSPHTLTALALPSNVRVRIGTSFRQQILIERQTQSAERKFSIGSIYVDGVTQGGVDGVTYLYLDRLFVENLGQFIAGQTYIVRGQITFEPSVQQ
jgi:hypothetical protein